MKKLCIFLGLLAIEGLLNAKYPYQLSNPAIAGEENAKGSNGTSPNALNLQSIQYMVLSDDSDFIYLDPGMMDLLFKMRQFFPTFDASCPDAVALLDALAQGYNSAPHDEGEMGVKQALDLVTATPITPTFNQIMSAYLIEQLTYYYNNLHNERNKNNRMHMKKLQSMRQRR